MSIENAYCRQGAFPACIANQLHLYREISTYARTVAENFDLIEKVVCRYNRALNISILLLIAITKVINVLCQDVEVGTVDFFLRRKIIRFWEQTSLNVHV